MDSTITNYEEDIINTNSISNLKKYLSSFNILDIGFITNVREDGRVDVVSNRLMPDDVPATYSNVEVLKIGCNGGGIIYDVVNTSCLILTPSSCMPDTESQLVAQDAYPFDRRGLKVLPLMKPSASSFLYFNQDGDISLTTPKGLVSLTAAGEFSISIGGTNILIDESGNIGIQGNNSYTVLLSDGTIRTGTMSNSKWVFIREIKNDGTITTYRGCKDTDNFPSQIMDMKELTEWDSVITESTEGIDIQLNSDSTINLSIKDGCTFKMTKDSISMNNGNLEVSK